MTSSELKFKVEQANPNSCFFSRENMKHHGDTMRNYGVRKAEVTTTSGETVKCWELYRRAPNKHGLKASAYFNAETYAQVFPSHNG